MAFNSKFQSKKASAEFFFLCHSFFCFCFCLFVFCKYRSMYFIPKNITAMTMTTRTSWSSVATLLQRTSIMTLPAAKELPAFSFVNTCDRSSNKLKALPSHDEYDDNATKSCIFWGYFIKKLLMPRVTCSSRKVTFGNLSIASFPENSAVERLKSSWSTVGCSDNIYQQYLLTLRLQNDILKLFSNDDNRVELLTYRRDKIE